MLDFSELKATDRVETRDGHIASEFTFVTENGHTFITGKVTPKNGSVLALLALGPRRWELNGRVAPMLNTTKSGLDLIKKIE